MYYYWYVVVNSVYLKMLLCSILICNVTSYDINNENCNHAYVNSG